MAGFAPLEVPFELKVDDCHGRLNRGELIMRRFISSSPNRYTFSLSMDLNRIGPDKKSPPHVAVSIYTDIRDTSPTPPPRFTVTVHLFNFETNTFRSVPFTLPRDESNLIDIISHADLRTGGYLKNELGQNTNTMIFRVNALE